MRFGVFVVLGQLRHTRSHDVADRGIKVGFESLDAAVSFVVHALRSGVHGVGHWAMLSYELVFEAWREVDTAVRKLMTRVQAAKDAAYRLVRHTTAAWLAPTPGRITRPFHPGQHAQLVSRLQGVREQIEAYCRQLDDRNVYARRAEDIRTLRNKMAATQRVLDQWYCGSVC